MLLTWHGLQRRGRNHSSLSLFEGGGLLHRSSSCNKVGREPLLLPASWAIIRGRPACQLEGWVVRMAGGGLIEPSAWLTITLQYPWVAGLQIHYRPPRDCIKTNCFPAYVSAFCNHPHFFFLGSGQLSCREPIVFLGILLLPRKSYFPWVKTHQTLHKGPVPCQIHSTPRTCAPPS